MKPLIEQITNQIKFEYDNGVLKAVQNVGFNVDKERLAKALMDSRSFYNEGYEDAKKKYDKKWIPCKERLPKDREEVLITDSDKKVRLIIFNKWLYENPQYSHNIIPIAWQPLPPKFEG